MSTKKFEISNIEWHYQTSREIRSSLNPPERIRTHMSAMSVQCKSCGAKWLSVEGRESGMFSQHIGGVRLSCPNCHNEGEISQDILNKI